MAALNKQNIASLVSNTNRRLLNIIACGALNAASTIALVGVNEQRPRTGGGVKRKRTVESGLGRRQASAGSAARKQGGNAVSIMTGGRRRHFVRKRAASWRLRAFRTCGSSLYPLRRSFHLFCTLFAPAHGTRRTLFLRRGVIRQRLACVVSYRIVSGGNGCAPLFSVNGKRARDCRSQFLDGSGVSSASRRRGIRARARRARRRQRITAGRRVMTCTAIWRATQRSCGGCAWRTLCALNKR